MARPLSQSLQDYVIDWQRGPWPLPWSASFGREAPLALEIGFGNGAFLAEQALARPERDHVGLELSWTSATHLFRRLNRTGLPNVRIVLGDAEALVQSLFAPESLCEVFVNHPCPWPKSRHAGRRLLAREFLACLAERMRPEARLSVVTDHAAYARWLGEELCSQSALVSSHASVEAASPPGRTPTEHQLAAMVHSMRMRYSAGDEAARLPAPSRPRSHECEVPMPTLTQSGEIAPGVVFRDFLPEFSPLRQLGVEVVVKL